VVTVALAFVPSTVTAVRAVREADRARTGGRVVRRGRLLRLTVPILETGMERAVSLAESMDSRGFARRAPTGADQAAAWCGLVSLLALAGAFVALVGGANALAVALGLVGGAALAAAVLLASRTGRARYRPTPMTAGDWGLVAAAVAAPAVVGLLALVGDHTLTWSATTLDLPRFNLLVALALVGLAAPAFSRPAARSRAKASTVAAVSGP